MTQVNWQTTKVPALQGLKYLAVSFSAAFLFAMAPHAAQAATPRTSPPRTIPTQPAVAPGIETLLSQHPDWIAGKKIGLVTNQTAVARDLRTTIELLAARTDCELVALFSPEHGIQGDVIAGKAVAATKEKATGLKVYSLYGETRRPTPAMMAGIDVLLYDIQDIGTRGYTYIGTLRYCMEEAFAAGKPFIVLDRPDPFGGARTDGPVTDGSLVSFVSPAPIPWIYGMTPGEYARWLHINGRMQGELRVAPLAGWKRGMLFEETGLPWIPPSPNVPSAETVYYHGITGALGELGVVSEGVGTPLPFQLVGAPWINADTFANALRARNVPGVRFSPYHFEPTAYGFKGQKCQGVQIHILDPKGYSPSGTTLAIVETLRILYPEKPLFDATPFPRAPEPVQLFDQVLGSLKFREWVRGGETAERIAAAWAAQRERFEPSRKQALLY